MFQVSLGKYVTIQEFLKSLLTEFDLDDEFDLRRLLYLELTNQEDARIWFKHLLYLLQRYLEEYVLEVSQTKDILFSLLGKGKKKSDTLTLSVPEISVTINDHPISNPILISQEILVKVNRGSASSSLKEVGTQHIITYPHMIDTSTTSTSASDSSETYDMVKRARICQKAKFRNMKDELAHHRKNSTEWTKQLEVDVLIYYKNFDICKTLARYLGLIFLEEGVTENDPIADVDEVLQCRTVKGDEKTIRLIQGHVTEHLLKGRNNLCITANFNLFVNSKARIRAVLYQKESLLESKKYFKYANIVIEIPNEAYNLHFIMALAEIEKFILNINPGINALFKNKDEYYQIKVPLCGFIPLYGLKVFSEILKNNELDGKLSLNSI